MDTPTTLEDERAAELEALVARAQDGEADAMEQVLAAVQPLVQRRCARILTFHGDAEDAAQEAMVLIATKLSSYKGPGNFLGWVSVVSSNSARSTYRKLKRQSTEQPREFLPEGLDSRTTSVIAGSRLDLLEGLEKLEASRPAVVEAFVLRDLAALPYEEIAQMVDAPLGTVKARIHEARKFMREQLAEKLG
ncbi:MAG: RNA polymerase sigma factor [Propionibacteriales bacterium]|nr:RNA polymerase sigma factor [Propionibacteriales bacterium]